MSELDERLVLTEVRAGVLVVTINRPRQKNSISVGVADLIAAAMERLDSDADLFVGVLTGAGGTFSAGADLKGLQRGERPYVAGRGFGGLAEAQPAKPLIAAVEGWALGGGFELALACDIIVAGESAAFGLPEVKRGLVARAGGLFRAPQRMPRAVAMEMLLTGDPIPAPRAQELHLVNHVVRDGYALTKALELASAIAANAPLAVAATKEIISRSRTMTDMEAFAWQEQLTTVVFASEDAKEGTAAFIEGRAPRWAGR